MRAYVLRRLLYIPFMLLAMSALLFYLLQTLPGDAAILKVGATGSCQECLQKVRADLGLDDPPVVQYFSWLGDIVRGDFGKTLGTNDEIGPEIRLALPKTIELAIFVLVLTLLIGIPLGVISAVKQGTILDYTLRFVTIAGLSVPVFWLGTLFVLLPQIWWDWTPLQPKYVSITENPFTNFKIMFWPALTLAVSSSAYVARLVRSSMLEVLYSDYVRTARAKGLRESAVILRHVLRGSLVTILTLIGTAENASAQRSIRPGKSARRARSGGITTVLEDSNANRFGSKRPSPESCPKGSLLAQTMRTPYALVLPIMKASERCSLRDSSATSGQKSVPLRALSRISSGELINR